DAEVDIYYNQAASSPSVRGWQNNDSTNTTVKTGLSDNPSKPYGELFGIADGTTASGTISDLRLALRLQEWFEKAARGGSRYVEQLKVHFNVLSSDKRMQRPEFLGGTRNPVVISEVLQTSSTDGTSPQANMAGHGISGSYGTNIRYYAEEHGYIFGIMSVMPDTAYQQGLSRHFTRKSWEDYAWPTFAHLSEQPILNQELYVVNDNKNEEIFGYIPRYSEYRYQPSRVAGEFRDSLSFWHLGRIFANRPLLNQDFVECKPRTDIFAVTDDENQPLWCHSYHKVFVKRKLPKYGVPTL
ncbi:MAG: major capsid protein, partial [Candidatus Bathyarchaeia archaeon]